jgi:hypothetical protein
MKVPTDGLINLFCSFQKAWDRAVPKSLIKENPVTIVTFVRLATKAGGVSQRELQEQLGLLQSAASKLTKTLFDEGWIKKLPNPNGDKRSELVFTTSTGRSAIVTLERCLRSTIPPASPRSARRRPKLPLSFVPLLSPAPENAAPDDEQFVT